MSNDHRSSALRDLQQLGLLSESQHLEADSHPRLTELADQPTPQATLEWLLRTGIVDARGVLDATRLYRRDLDAETSAARRALVADTLRQINQQSVDALLAEALITQEIHQIISASLMTDRALLTPAATMALVIEAQMLPWDEYQALQARPASQRSAAANAILAETAVLVEERHRERKREFWAQVFPGPRWLYVAGAPLLIGALFWYVTPSSALPDCASDEARKTLNGTIIASVVSNPTSLDGGGFPSISGLQEVGYNKVRAMRGCTGRMKLDEDTRPFAYVIERNPDRQKGGFVLSGADPDIITARFGKLGANGDFLYQAEPIGRSGLEQAFRAGAAAFNDNPASQRLGAMARNVAGQSASDTDAHPRRESDVEPLGACRAQKPGNGYTCPLLFEWHNPLMAMLGHNDRQVLRGEFTFEPNAAGTVPAWRVSSKFAEEFDRAELAADKKDAKQDNKTASR
jgi:hypothetical protein